MALTITKKAGEAVTDVQHKVSGQETHSVQGEEVVGEVKTFIDPPCEVGVNLSYTKNLGDYNSVKVGVSVMVPCAHDEIDAVYDYAKDWADVKLQAMLEEV